MNRAFATCGRKLSEADIIKLEEVTGVRVPPEYRMFLLRTNGGRLRVPYEVPLPSCFGDEIEDFYSIDHDIECLDVAKSWACLGNYTSKGLLPIASSIANSLVCIDTQSKDAIVYLDMSEPLLDDGTKHRWPLAPDLSTLLRNMGIRVQ